MVGPDAFFTQAIRHLKARNVTGAVSPWCPREHALLTAATDKTAVGGAPGQTALVLPFSSEPRMSPFRPNTHRWAMTFTWIAPLPLAFGMHFDARRPALGGPLTGSLPDWPTVDRGPGASHHQTINGTASADIPADIP
jgi:hypothetical protein